MSMLPVAPDQSSERRLTAAQFHALAAVPAEAEWFANLDNPHTRRAYRIDLHAFMGFTGIARPEEFRVVTRAHVLAWRKSLEERALSGATIRRKLAALSSLFDYLGERNAVDTNPVKGAKRRSARPTRARRRHWATTRRAHCSTPRMRQPSRAGAIARCCRYCCTTGCVARSCVD